MTCKGCKYFSHPINRHPICKRFLKDEPVRCIDFRHKQGQRVK
jgi:hypothetical protein